jgi:hypothetical protein
MKEKPILASYLQEHVFHSFLKVKMPGISSTPNIKNKTIEVVTCLASNKNVSH